MSPRLAIARDHAAIAVRRSASTAWTSTASACRWRRSSPTWTASTREPRRARGRDAVLVGFTTYEGTVTAASDWGAAAERMRVRRALEGSHEGLLHESGIPAFLLCPLGETRSGRALREPRLERAIGVVYRPANERASHYLTAGLSRQFDALVHIDATRAVEPLERTCTWELGEPPETYSTAI